MARTRLLNAERDSESIAGEILLTTYSGYKKLEFEAIVAIQLLFKNWIIKQELVRTSDL